MKALLKSRIQLMLLPIPQRNLNDSRSLNASIILFKFSSRIGQQLKPILSAMRQMIA